MIYLSEVRKSPEGLAFNEAPSLLESIKAVSYTHLDVYKRQ